MNDCLTQAKIDEFVKCICDHVAAEYKEEINESSTCLRNVIKNTYAEIEHHFLAKIQAASDKDLQAFLTQSDRSDIFVQAALSEMVKRKPLAYSAARVDSEDTYVKNSIFIKLYPYLKDEKPEGGLHENT